MVDNELVFSALAEFTHTLVQRYAIADVLTHLTFQVPAALDIFGAGVSVGDEDGRRFAQPDTLGSSIRTRAAAAVTDVSAAAEVRRRRPRRSERTVSRRSRSAAGRRKS